MTLDRRGQRANRGQKNRKKIMRRSPDAARRSKSSRPGFHATPTNEKASPAAITRLCAVRPADCWISALIGYDGKIPRAESQNERKTITVTNDECREAPSVRQKW